MGNYIAIEIIFMVVPLVVGYPEETGLNMRWVVTVILMNASAYFIDIFNYFIGSLFFAYPNI